MYESALAKFVASGQPVRLLEIGVQNGGSLQIWSKYLPQRSEIVGIDIDPACAALQIDPNVSIRIGDATDPTALDRMLTDTPFDIIIDDGSHRSEHVIATFQACFRRLKPGGLYFIEDLHASYFASYGGGFRRADASVEWLKGLIDALSSDHFENEAAQLVGEAELERLHVLGGQIACIAFFDSLVLIEKLARNKTGPYRRILTGRDANVVTAAQIIPNLSDLQLQRQTLLLAPSTAASFAPTLLKFLATAQKEVRSVRAEKSHLAAGYARALADLGKMEEIVRQNEMQIATLNEYIKQKEVALEVALTETRARVRLLEDALGRKEVLAHAAEEAVRQEFARHVEQLAGLRRPDHERRMTTGLTLSGVFSRKRRRELRRRTNECSIITSSPLFDAEWYMAANPDVAAHKIAPALHYLLYGAKEGRAAGPHFDGAEYQRANTDVLRAGINPLIHYVIDGRREGRPLSVRHPKGSVLG